MKTITLKSGKEIELNQAFNMDCLEFMKDLPDKCIDLVLTDPPYGINFDGNTTVKGKGGKADTFSDKQHHIKKAWDSCTPESIVFDEMQRISKNQIIWGGNYFTDKLPVSRGWIYWDKKITNKGNTNFSDGELAWTSYNAILRKVTCDWIGFGYLNNKYESRKIHPTQKPLGVINFCIENYLKEGNIIFDPFLGSFTTAIASENLNLNWIGCEKDPDYFKSGYHRYEQETKQLLMEF